MDRLRPLLFVAWLAVVWIYSSSRIQAIDTSGLLEGTDGAFYGLTSQGEVYNEGHGVPFVPPAPATVVRLTKGGSYKTLAVFTGSLYNPAGPLVQAYDGNFYGLANANSWNPNPADIIYRVFPSGKLETVAFVSNPPRVDFEGKLIIGPRGNLYGISSFEYEKGVSNIFKVSLDGVVTILKTFAKGTTPSSSELSVGPDGNLYFAGTLFRLTANEPPIASDDSFELPVVHANVIANDSDPKNDPVKIVSVTDGSHGTVTFTWDGTVTYSPGPDFNAGGIQSDTFTYTIRDPLGGTATATVTVTVPQDIFRAGSGSYSGMLTSGGPPKGYLNLTLTKTGAFSGTLLVDGIKTPVTGTFGTDGTYSATISRDEPLPALTVTLHLDVISNAITGTVSDGTNSYSATLSRNLTLSSLKATPLRGNYTALITNNETGPSLPGGSGFARMSVTANGAVMLIGKLGDGRPFSAGASLNSEDIVPLYVRPYSRNEGYLAGQIAFRITDTDDASGSLTWHRPPRSNAAYYPAGFTTAPTFQATRYMKLTNFAYPTYGFEYLGLGNDATLSLGEKPPKKLRWKTYSLTMRARPFDGTKVTFDPQTGLFRGTYFDAGILYTVRGAIYQYRPGWAEGLSLDQNGTSHVSITPYYGP
jgi:Bacterial Ig domain